MVKKFGKVYALHIFHVANTWQGWPDKSLPVLQTEPESAGFDNSDGADPRSQRNYGDVYEWDDDSRRRACAKIIPRGRCGA